MSVRAVRLLLSTASGSCAARVERRTMAGLPVLVAGRSDGRATLVFANACTPRGIDEPAVAAFIGAAAREGLNVVAPELPDVAAGRITPETVDALVRVAEECEGTLVLAGASTGGGLAIVAAADPRIVGRVERVSAVAPFADLTNVLRLATTGHYLEDGALHPYAVEPRLRWATERSLRAMGGVSFEGRDPEGFDAFYATMPGSTRAAIDALSPIAGTTSRARTGRCRSAIPATRSFRRPRLAHSTGRSSA